MGERRRKKYLNCPRLQPLAPPSSPSSLPHCPKSDCAPPPPWPHAARRGRAHLRSGPAFTMAVPRPPDTRSCPSPARPRARPSEAACHRQGSEPPARPRPPLAMAAVCHGHVTGTEGAGHGWRRRNGGSSCARRLAALWASERPVLLCCLAGAALNPPRAHL